MAPGLSESVDPTLRERLSRALRPDFARTVLARRLTAGALVLLAAAAALRPDPAGSYAEVAVAATDLRPGVVLGPDDVRAARRPVTTLPDGALTDIGGLAGATVAGPVRRGEILTDARVLSSRLAGLSVGPDARVVPVRLSDPAVLDVLRSGDVVDVLAAASSSSHDGDRDAPRVLATGAVVVLVSAGTAKPGADGDRVVLVALPRAAAIAVAGAGLLGPVSLTVH